MPIGGDDRQKGNPYYEKGSATMSYIEKLKSKILSGGSCTKEEALLI